jgi:hypothetical protein
MTHYIPAPAKVTECHNCGETVMCEVIVADSIEQETGYRDEYALCEVCKNGDS